MAQVAIEGLRVRNLRSSAAPLSGTFTQGDLAWNTAPTDGNPIGWVCVAGGTPGTWEPFGSVGTATGGSSVSIPEVRVFAR